MNSPLVWDDDREYNLSSLYALNRIVREFRIAIAREIPIASNLLVVPYLYNARTRTFQQMGFADSNWPPSEEGNWSLQTVLDLMKKDEEGVWTDSRQLQEILSFLRFNGGSSGADKPRNLIARLEKFADDEDFTAFRGALQENLGLSFRKWSHLYAHYKFPRDMYLNGIFWSLRSKNPDIDAILLRRDESGGETLALNPGVMAGNNSESWITWTKRQSDWDTSPEVHQQTKASATPRGAKFAFALSEYFLSSRHRQIDAQRPRSNTIGLVPIYSTWLSGHGYGGVIAVLQVQLDSIAYAAGATEAERRTIQEGVIKKLIDMAEILAVDLCSAAIQRATTERIAMHSGLTEVFVNTIQYLQDWEMIMLNTLESSAGLEYRRYHYTHDMRGGCLDVALDENLRPENWVARGWDSSLLRTDFATMRGDPLRSEPPQALLPCHELASACPVQLIWEATTDAASSVQYRRDASIAHVNLSDVFSGIDTGTMRRPQSARFTFPANFRLPSRALENGDANPLWRAFCNALVRQQKELLAALAPRLIARQQALRTAVSAIMGRNMSHNIGSHVLARYSSDIARDLGKATKHRPDHRGDLLSYLQRRMDFLAEVATSDAAFWAQPLSLKEQVNRLNYRAQRQRFVDDVPSQECARKPAGTCKAPVLLSYITGKQSLAANVEFGKPAAICPKDEGCLKQMGFVPDGKQGDTLFSCPGGEVGAHALFVILENIIRNSARHNPDAKPEDSCGAVSLFVAIDESNSTPDLIKIDIIDPRTVLHADGESVKRQGTGSLPKWINNILNNEPLLMESGRPNPQFWGVREMQICAHYLRGLPLSELETSDYGKEPLIKADLHKGLPGSSGVNCLKYEIYLRRAKLLAAIFNETSLLDAPSADLSAGVLLLRKVDCNSWASIAGKVQGFSYLAVTSDEDRWLPSIEGDEATSALLPVRRVTILKTDLEKHIQVARAAMGNTSWMEPLHRECGLRYKKNHENWRERQDVWGVGIVDSENYPSEGEPAEVPTIGAIRWVRKSGQKRDPEPLPDSWRDIPERLQGNGDHVKQLGAAWIFHLTRDDIDTENNYAGFADAYKDSGENSKNWICVEGTFSDSVQQAYLKSAFQSGCDQELLASAYPRLAIIDERVQSACIHTIRNCRLDELWPLMGVWVPHKDFCDLDQPDMVKCQEFLRGPVVRADGTRIRDDQRPIDFLVVHLTILERLRAASGLKTLDATLRTLRNGTWAESPQVEVVVVTGRGVPAVAMADGADHLSEARYLPVSALLESLVIRPSKLALMRVLWSARRPH